MPLHGASWRFEPGGRARGGTYVALHHLRRRRARGALRVPGFGARSRESAVGRRPFRRPLGAHGGQAAGARARCASVLAPSAPPPPPLPAARAPSPLHRSGPGPSVTFGRAVAVAHVRRVIARRRVFPRGGRVSHPAQRQPREAPQQGPSLKGDWEAPGPRRGGGAPWRAALRVPCTPGGFEAQGRHQWRTRDQRWSASTTPVGASARAPRANGPIPGTRP